MDNYVNQEMVLHLARAMASSKEKEAMTRSDYKIIAVGIAKSALPSLEKRIVAEDLGKELIKENPRFNVEKFIEACLTTYDTTDHPAGPAQAPL